MISAPGVRTFLVLWVLSIVIAWPVLGATLALSLREDAYTHILLILPISLGILIVEWGRHEWNPKAGVRLGVPLLLLAGLIGAAAVGWLKAGIITTDVYLTLGMLALVVWWIGSFVFAFGGAMFRARMFPLLFLLFLVPAPTVALNYMVHFLQVESATAARLLFVSVGIPAKQDASVVAIPGLTLEVATECSSIRSSMMLVVTTVVTAHLLLRSVWAKGVVSLLAIPLSVAKNGVRIFVLSILGVYVDQRILDGPLHHQGGIVFFALSLAGLFAMLWAAGWIERRNERRKGKGLGSVILNSGSGVLVGSREG